MGHQAAECTAQIQGVDNEWEEMVQDSCSVEVGGAWVVGCVEQIPLRTLPTGGRDGGDD